MSFKSNYKSVLVTIILIITGFSILLYAHATGIIGVTKKGNTPGCTCHAENPTATVIVTINGPDTLKPGQTANYSITITGGPLKSAGTDIAVSAGTLAPVTGDLQLLNSELTHTLPKAPVSGVVTFDFTYTAPFAEGFQTIFANGNSVNLNGQNTGDEWNFAPNKTIQVTSVLAAVEDKPNAFTYRLEQNYPNPFNPSTNIRYSIRKNEFVSLKVFDLLGNEVANLVNEEKPAGNYTVIFSSNRNKNISSGVYFYILKAGNFSATKKFILLK